ncbi:hypothetical protein [Noviherbaspirillum galbum]|uniref:Lipoprotein n=1 Tax=Noviherbaspirillum galbum TaxID=2709383 RepID=A0A6B3STI8_9BURK|nr:hypothetical protein [Noviherbaspirillum galbum]NEX64077.1 hypothetical protein [Noviherbaspirillum galbum]
MRNVIWVSIAFAMIVLSGCAHGPMGSASGTVSQIDAEKVAAVEHVARQHGIEVVWVNVPEISVARSAAATN